MTLQRPEPHAGLPAPYESPWRRLGADLVAVLFSTRLKLRELWRRNAAGTLFSPPFWPAGLAPFFWPLLLLVSAALIAAAGLFVGTWLAGSGADLPGNGAADPREPARALRQPAGARDRGAASVGKGGEIFSADRGDGTASGTAAADAGPAPAGGRAALPPGDAFPAPLASASQPPARPAAEPSPDALAAAGEPPPPPAAAELSPEERLLGALQHNDPQIWLVALEASAPASLLRATVAPGFSDLPEPDRSRQAASWLARAQAQGYERLELRDARGRLLARPARVGSGMILLAPPPSVRDDPSPRTAQ